MIKILIVACLIGIIISLGTGLFHLVNDKGNSKKMANALTIRVALSVALFVLLFIAWKQGLIQPHGISKWPSKSGRRNYPGPCCYSECLTYSQ